MPTRPPKHKLPTVQAKSHAREFYDRQTRQRTAGLKTAADLRNSSFWKKVRLTFISRNPVCCNPHGFHDGFAPAAQQVHHIEPIQKAPHLAFTHSNLMALCTRCHAVFSARERADEEDEIPM